MNKPNDNKNVRTYIFWGSLWGLSEATIGSLFHIVPWIAGFFMFPVAFYFMKKALNDSRRLSAIFYTAAVAAGIKLTGLLFPFQQPATVINPAAAIMMEALAVILFFKVFGCARNHYQPREILTAAFGWRIAFIAYHLLLVSLSLYDGILQWSALTLARFLVLESIADTVIIALLLRVEISRREPMITRLLKPGFSVSFVLLAAAVVAQFML